MADSHLSVDARFEAAVALHNAARFEEARHAYEALIRDFPTHAEAMHNLGLLFVQHRQFAEAAEWMQKAIQFNPSEPIYFSNYGNVLQDSLRHAESVPQYQRALELKPEFADAYFNLANALQKLGNQEEAIRNYQRTIALNPLRAEAHLNFGNSCDALGRYNDALICYEKVIECSPYFAGGHINRANTLLKLGRKPEAMAGYEYATTISTNAHQAYVGMAEILIEESKYREAVANCLAAIKIKDTEPLPYYLMGSVYFRMRDLDQAAASFQRATQLKPDYADAYNGLGLCYTKAGHFEEAVKNLRKALELNPNLAMARINLGDTFFTFGDLKSALECFQLLEPGIQPLGLMQFFKMQLGDWSNFDADRARFLSQIRSPRLMGLTEDPWHVQRVVDSPALAKEVAQSFYKNATRNSVFTAAIEKRPRGEKIKVGYYSPDFREHAVSHLALELFETLPRDKFELYAFSFKPTSPADEMRPKLVEAFDHFIQVHDKNDLEVVKLSRELGIDIAIDLAGITSEARVGIFANRAAPIQVNFLGFTGTIGTDCHDYIIVDPIVVPYGTEDNYTEKVARIPCVMPFDTRHNIFDKKPSRQEVGLPATGFVFCSFNQCFKFTPATFDSWMRILSRVPDSCLWLSPQRPQAIENFHKEAKSRGIDPQRIIFAPRVRSMEEHLSRLQCADLFLDTFPYNAHTSAADVLWAGVPVITRMGDSYASRLAGSLISSLGLKDLIVPNVEIYEHMAVELATQPGKLDAFKQKLKNNRSSSSIFNSKLYLKNYVGILTAMYERSQAGLPPDDIEIKA